ncbi:MAG TPA: N-acetylmuramoyl-L-alanine amidase [Ignavibacteria bacterium]|nr:N-acetylmuramoyl-L-alanine amidase [Ignavibacteria bacterium]
MIKNFFLLFIVHCSLLIVYCSLLMAQNKLEVIVIDAGHGGKDPGTIGDKTGVQEKNIVLPLSLKLGSYIEKKFPGIKVIYTRITDEFIELKERTKLANNSKAGLFISIHANHKKKEESEKNGFEIYLLNRERFGEAVLVTMKENTLLSFKQSGGDSTDAFIFSSLAQTGYNKFNEYLASHIELSLISSTQLMTRGVIQAGFWVIIGASMPAVLVETGYLSDINDEKYLSSEKGQNDVALGLFNAFQNYKILFESQ